MQYEKDWLMQQVQIVGESIARLFARVEQTDDPSEHVRLTDEFGEEVETWFHHSRYARLDAANVARLMRPPTRLRAYIAALTALYSLVEDDDESQSSRRILELSLELHLLGVELTPSERTVLEELIKRHDPTRLGDRYREALRSLDLSPLS